jgi:hypothetical protein
MIDRVLSRPPRVVVAAVAVQLGALLSGQVAWEQRTANPNSVAWHALAYDAARAVTVQFGGQTSTQLDETWEWNGTAWQWRHPLQSPPPRQEHALAYDAARGVIVLFGGFPANTPTLSFGDTWEYDGVTWRDRTPATGPWPRHDHALAWHAARGRTVLFGGTGITTTFTTFGDTWEWDGTNWVQAASSGPPARSNHPLAYDAARGRTVLFGGRNGAAPLGDTWEWSGTWVQRTVSPAPPPRYNDGLVYDPVRNRTVLIGGQDAQSFGLFDTWEWDGTSWTQLGVPTTPTLNNPVGLVHDAARGCLVMRGRTQTFERNGLAWVDRTVVMPPARRYHALAQDPGRSRTVMFGGGGGGSTLLDDTWEWDGSGWIARAPSARPVARLEHAMAHDPARGRTVLFGGAALLGSSHNTPLGDTWEWDGTSWTQRAAAGGPSPRLEAAMAYDAARAVTVLFGGSDAALGSRDDTWTWDGTGWTQRTPATSPPARFGHALAYDEARARTVLFGGRDGALVALNDTWEWDGSTWQLRQPALAPSPRYNHGLAYDRERGRTVLHGADTWEWDGTAWAQRSTPVTMPARNTVALAYDPSRGVTVLFSGVNNLPDTWVYGPTLRGRFDTYGSGCAGSAGTPTLAANDGLRPYPGQRCTTRVDGVPAGAAVFVAFGLSQTAWGALALPFDLTPLGMPGCSVLSSADFSFLVFANGTAATFSTLIPNSAITIATSFSEQCFVLDPAANPAGITASNAALATVGGM